VASRIVGKIEEYARDPDSLANRVIAVSTGYRRLRVGDFRVIFRENAAEIEILDIAHAAESTIETRTMTKAHIFRTPGGEELVVMAREEYDTLQDAAVAAARIRDLAEGREELLTSVEVEALLKAPTPLAFWRKKRRLTQTVLANDVGVSQNFLSDVERGKAIGDVVLYAKLARRLGISIEDLVPDDERQA